MLSGNKVYIVQHVSENQYSCYDVFRTEKAFTTLEKAEAYKLQLETEHKDNVRFQHNFWWYNIEELEIW